MSDLKHYGVKGMKWGVRRSKQARPPSNRKIKKQSVKREKQWVKTYQRRGTMSDTELRETLNRLRMENEFNRLATEASMSQRKKAKVYIKTMSEVAVSAKTTGVALKGAIAASRKATVGV